jgi:hypothetical protein
MSTLVEILTDPASVVVVKGVPLARKVTLIQVPKGCNAF